MIGFILKNKFGLGAGVAALISLGGYWWMMNSKINSLETELALKNQQVIECRQLYAIEQAAVETLVSTVEQENLRVQSLRVELNNANARAAKQAQDIINQANRTQHEGAKTPEEMNTWFKDLFN